MKVLDLFAGIGGFSLAAHWMGWETVAFVEWDEFCQKVLKKNFPNVPVYGDIKEFDGTQYNGTIDLICGGFPCQDISISGNGAGIYGSKSAYWFEMYRVIKEVCPRFILIENSPEIFKKGLEIILLQLAEIGYDAEWETFRASEFGFDHLRERAYILAYSNAQGWEGLLHSVKTKLIDANTNEAANTLDSQRHPFLRFTERYSKPAVFGIHDGFPKRLDVVGRLAGCGNAIVPQIAFEIFKAIEEIEINNKLFGFL